MPAGISRILRNPALRSGVFGAFALSGLFRLSAFVRETYVAARFGLSSATDAYFGLQQIPLSVATFMFGAFAIAFAPAYSRSSQRAEGGQWMPGLILHGMLAGLALTGITLALSPLILGRYVGAADITSAATLRILSFCYVPIIFVAIWSSMLNATGHALQSMNVAALPYLIMTGSLVLICEWSGPELLTLPVSMAIGFGLTAAVAAWAVLRRLRAPRDLLGVLWPMRMPEFRSFSRQLLASGTENAGFAGNQLLMFYFFGLAGTGEVTANNYAMRIGLLANSLIVQPLAQLAQSRFCSARPEELRRSLSAYLGLILAGASFAAVSIFAFRGQIVELLYQRGRFTSGDAQAVTALIPGWLAYLFVQSACSIVARYMFMIREGRRYAAYMLGGYLLTNVMRAVCCGFGPYPPALVWCAVIGEGIAVTLCLRACYWPAPHAAPSPIAVPVP